MGRSHGSEPSSGGENGMTSRPPIEDLLAEYEQEVGRFSWEGTFADYLCMAIENPSLSRLSHKLVYDAIMVKGSDELPTGEPVYALFEDEIFGLEAALDSIVQYFASSSRRLEVRKRILLLLGPPASGKSSVLALIKRAMESYTRSDDGATYAISGCPMQEEPLHLVPYQLRDKLYHEHGVYVEGDLCPRCRYVLRTRYGGKVSQMPVTRVTFSETEAVGIGYYVATNPNPSDASLLLGSIDTSQLEGDRLEVAGKAFRLDGEFNVANRGMIEFVEIFKADRHLLTTLLGLAQEQLIKMERFGSIYADEVVVAHSNEGDFSAFASDEHSEALRDRLIAVQIPYNLRVRDEVKIYEKMLATSGREEVHMPPLTLQTMSVFAVFSRLEPPDRQGMSMVDKLRLYDGQMVQHYSADDLVEMMRHHPNEGMHGTSPRYVMNRLSVVAGSAESNCITPLKALDSLWRGLRENVSLDDADRVQYIEHIKQTVEEYSHRAIQEVQKAFEERFEQTASELLFDHLANTASHVTGLPVRDHITGTEHTANERDMREMEKHIGIADRDRAKFRGEIHLFFANYNRRGIAFDYKAEPRLKAAIESRLFPDRKTLERDLGRPRLARRQAEWARRRGAIYNRLVTSYGYCPECAEDIIEYVIHVIRGRAVLKTPKNEGIEWQWNLNPLAPPAPATPQAAE